LRYEYRLLFVAQVQDTFVGSVTGSPEGFVLAAGM